MAITTEEQIDQYRSAKAKLNQIERDIEQLQVMDTPEGKLTSDVRGFGIYVNNLEEHEAREIHSRVLVMLEEKYEHVSAELEEMLK